VKTKSVLSTLALGALVIVGCGAGGGGAGADVSATTGQQDYGATKQMVLDILHSQEGKTALQDIMKDPAFKQQIIVSDSDITKAVTASIESKKTQSFLSEQAKDPKFAAALSKALQPELIQTSKQLMKDPDYQKDVMVLLKSPDFTQHLQTLLESPDGRKIMMKVMTEALDNPGFRIKFEQSLKQAVSDAMKSTGGGGGKQQAGGGQGGQGGGGEEGGGGGGSSS
jgi:spore germination protein D